MNLRVGQTVRLRAGVYELSGIVTKIRWWGIYVKTDSVQWGTLRFDKNGKEWGSQHPFFASKYPFFEGGPWEIVDMLDINQQLESAMKGPMRSGIPDMVPPCDTDPEPDD